MLVAYWVVMNCLIAVISAIDVYRRRYTLFCFVYLVCGLFNFTLQVVLIVVILLLLKKIRLEIAIAEN